MNTATRRAPTRCEIPGCTDPFFETVWMPRNHSWKRVDFCHAHAQSAYESGKGFKNRPEEPPTTKQARTATLNADSPPALPLTPPPEKRQRLDEIPCDPPGSDPNTWEIQDEPKKLFCRLKGCNRVGHTRGLCGPHYHDARTHDRLEEFGAPPKRKTNMKPIPTSPVITAANATSEALTHRIRDLEQENETQSSEVAALNAALGEAKRALADSAAALARAAVVEKENEKLKQRTKEAEAKAEANHARWKALGEQIDWIDQALYGTKNPEVRAMDRADAIAFLWALVGRHEHANTQLSSSFENELREERAKSEKMRLELRDIGAEYAKVLSFAGDLRELLGDRADLSEEGKAEASQASLPGLVAGLITQVRQIDADLYGEGIMGGLSEALSRAEAIRHAAQLLRDCRAQMDRDNATIERQHQELREKIEAWKLDGKHNMVMVDNIEANIEATAAATLEFEIADLDGRIDALHLHLDQIDEIIGFDPLRSSGDIEADRLACLRGYGPEVTLDAEDLQHRAALSRETRQSIERMTGDAPVELDTMDGRINVDTELRGHILTLLRSRDLKARTITRRDS